MSHVISAWSTTSSVHSKSGYQCMIATWSVHAQPRDLDLISHVISACRVTWSGPAELRDSCRLICMTIASWAAWFLSAHLLDNCQLSCVIPAWSPAWLLPVEQHDSTLPSSMLIACWLRGSCLLSSLSIASWGPCSGATCRGPAPTDPGYSKERWPRRLFIC